MPDPVNRTPYNVIFTPAARAFGEVKAGSIEALEQQVRKELDEELDCPLDHLIFHCLFVGDTTFICYPDGKGTIEVDLAEDNEIEPAAGPLKGRKVILPSPRGR